MSQCKCEECGCAKKPTRKYGWKRDHHDHRDRMWMVGSFAAKTLPPIVDLRKKCPPVYNQGDIGSCTANAIAGAYQYDEINGHTKVDFTPSRLFIYWNERDMEGTVDTDSGAAIRDGIKSINVTGVCSEALWPYGPGKFTAKPTAQCYAQAKGQKALAYARLDNTNLNQLKMSLAAGLPFVCGIQVYASFESDQVAKSGMVPMPASGEQLLGGHAIMCVGYDDAKKCFIMRNSWGPGWGLAGYFYIPYAYLTSTSLASDFWVVKKVSGEKATSS